MSGWIVETLVASTLLMVLVLLVRERVATLFGARIAYLLWLLPALRMVLPPLPESFGPAPMEHLPVAVIDLQLFHAPALAAAPVEAGIDWPLLALALWLGGAAAMMTWHLIAYRRFVRAAMAQSVDLPEMDRDGIEVCASSAVEGPFATGIFLPQIVLPHDWRSRYSAEELRLAMKHETVHHQRCDLTVNILALAIFALHWFNPVAWRAWRAFRADQELACDAVVLDRASGDERHSYASALVKSACSRTPIAACSLNPREELKRRLRMMSVARERGAAGMMVTALALGGGLLITASGGIAAAPAGELKREMQARVIAPAVEAVTVAKDEVQVAMGVAPAIPSPPSPRRAADPAPAPALAAAPVTPEAAAPVPAVPALPEMPAAPARAVAGLAHAEFAQIQADVHRDVAEGLRAAREVRAVRLAPVRPHGSTCRNGSAMGVTADDGHGARTRVTVCTRASDPARQYKAQISALVEAREGLDEIHGLDRKHLAKAMAALDAEIAKLKAKLHAEDMH